MGSAHQPGKSVESEVDAGLCHKERLVASLPSSDSARLPDAPVPNTSVPNTSLLSGDLLGTQEATASELPQLEDWLAQLVSGDFQTRWEISKTLKHHPIGVLGPLLSLLSHAKEDEELLWFIARLLGEIDHPEAVDSLVNILQSATTTEMQSVAALALANRGRSALPALAQLLIQPETRLLVVQVLSQIDAVEVVDLLMGVVNDADADVRCAAIDALGGFADPRIAPLLLLALQDPDSAVRRLALRAVGARSMHLPGVALDEAIAPLLHDLNAQVVEQAIVALGRLDTSLGRHGLAQVLSGTQWPLPLQFQAVRALGWSRADDAIERLIARFDAAIAIAAQGQTVEQGQAVETAALPLAREIVVVLGRLRTPQRLELAAQALEARLPAIFEQRDGDLKRATALTLGQLGQASSFDALCAYLLDPSPGLTFHILAGLRRLDPETGRARLQALAEQMASETAGSVEVEAMSAAIAEWT